MQKQNTILLFVGINEEGEIVSRIAKSPNFDVHSKRFRTTIRND